MNLTHVQPWDFIWRPFVFRKNFCFSNPKNTCDTSFQSWSIKLSQEKNLGTIMTPCGTQITTQNKNIVFFMFFFAWHPYFTISQQLLPCENLTFRSMKLNFSSFEWCVVRNFSIFTHEFILKWNIVILSLCVFLFNEQVNSTILNKIHQKC